MSCTNCPSKGFSDITTTELIESEYSKQSPYDWLKDIPVSANESLLVEISFKNNRKDFYINQNEINIKRGDYVAVQCDHGHGVGMVTLTGKMAELQLKRKENMQKPEKIIYRMASKFDIEKLTKARFREKPVMVKARQLAQSLELEMKISDVEFQGDGSKATFYYIADGRIDYRELIKLYAQEFSVRIEMKQIGARQESALIGGMGSCGRELCCSSWRNSFDSVSTQAARVQELPHNAQKLTGQCGKLKCCLMYELDQYIEAHSDFPDILLELETNKGIAYPRKKELLKKIIWYSYSSATSTDLIPVPLERAKEIIQLNKKGIKPQLLDEQEKVFFGFTNSEKQVSLEDRLEQNKTKKVKYRPKRNKKTILRKKTS
ncbi:MAG: regulatory iron-sulfur-containing complex subunit RicT [Bacteroidales bacterium]|nr:regulatory iron-sulfur-containing complex subunit RicT [Bacteroidales bacterium]